MPKAQSKSGTKDKATERAAAIRKATADSKKVIKATKDPKMVYLVQRTIGYAYGGNQVIAMHVFDDEQDATDMVAALDKAVQDLLGHRIEHYEGRTVGDAYQMVGMESVTHRVFPKAKAKPPSKIIT